MIAHILSFSLAMNIIVSAIVSYVYDLDIVAVIVAISLLLNFTFTMVMSLECKKSFSREDCWKGIARIWKGYAHNLTPDRSEEREGL